MKSKTLLVLGGSRHQIQTIQTAKKMGCRVVTTDNVNDNPGHMYSDVSYDIDTTDKDKILEVARKENIDGVISPCTDVAVPTAAYLSEQLNLPGININKAVLLTNKVLFRQFQLDNGLPHPDFYVVDNCSDNYQFDSSSKVVVKPDFSSGSKGVFIVSDDGLADRVKQSLEYSPNDRVIIEDFIEGEQLTVEGFLINGEIMDAFFLKRQTPKEPYVSTIGHYYPCEIPSYSKKNILSQIKSIWDRLEIEDCVFDADIVFSDNQSYVLEMTPRLGGNSITELLLLSCKVNLSEIAINIALGDKVEYAAFECKKHFAVLILGVWNSGVLNYDEEIIKDLIQEDWISDISIFKSNGSFVHPFSNGRYAIGKAFISGSSYSDLQNKDDRLRALLNMRAIKK